MNTVEWPPCAVRCDKTAVSVSGKLGLSSDEQRGVERRMLAVRIPGWSTAAPLKTNGEELDPLSAELEAPPHPPSGAAAAAAVTERVADGADT